jgi:hypothetical protein
MTNNDLSEATCQRGLLVHLELKEATDRMRKEGFTFTEISAGIASHANEVIAAEHSQATASAWFFGMAKQAANFAAQQMGLGKPGEG